MQRTITDIRTIAISLHPVPRADMSRKNPTAVRLHNGIDAKYRYRNCSQPAGRITRVKGKIARGNQMLNILMPHLCLIARYPMASSSRAPTII